MTKKLKNILLITFSAFLALSAALMLALTSNRANKVSADEQYCEYWVIDENAVCASKTITMPFSYNNDETRYTSMLINFTEENFIIAYFDGGVSPLYALSKDNTTNTYKYFSPLSGVDTGDGVDYETFKNSTGFLKVFANTNENGTITDLQSIAKRYCKISIKTIDGEIITDGLYNPYGDIDTDGQVENAVSAYEKPGYTFKGLSLDQSGAELLDMTAYNFSENEVTLYAVYEETPTEPGGEENPSEEPTLGDKINEVTDNIASWIKDNTGLAFSSGGVILLAVVLALILFKRR